MERGLVQILVAVANIQQRPLKAEAEKVSVPTVLVHGSVGPNVKANASKHRARSRIRGQPRPATCPLDRKGSRSTFRHQSWRAVDAATRIWQSL